MLHFVLFCPILSYVCPTILPPVLLGCPAWPQSPPRPIPLARPLVNSTTELVLVAKFVRGRKFRVHELAEHKGSVKKGVFLSTFRFVGARELAAARESWRTRPHCTRAIPHPPPHRAQPFEPPSRRYAGVARTTRGARGVPGKRWPWHIIHCMARFHALPSRMCLHDRHIMSPGQGAKEQRRRPPLPQILSH